MLVCLYYRGKNVACVEYPRSYFNFEEFYAWILSEREEDDDIRRMMPHLEKICKFLDRGFEFDVVDEVKGILTTYKLFDYEFIVWY